MACEKLCKAHLIDRGTPPDQLQPSHGYVARPLPVILRQLIVSRKTSGDTQRLLKMIRLLAAEIELLNPAVDRHGRLPDNCEYPWQQGENVLSPLDWTFNPTTLLTAPSGRTFIKLLRLAIDGLL